MENLHSSLENILPKSICSTGFGLEIIHESTFSAKRYGDMQTVYLCGFHGFHSFIVDGNNDMLHSVDCDG